MTQIPRNLREHLRNGTVIPFVGAGVSMAVRRIDGSRLFPSWRELLIRGADCLDEELKTKDATLVRALLEVEDSDYQLAAQWLRDKLGPVWISCLKEQIDVPREEADGRSLALAQAVWQLGSQLILTTNYDQVLEWACPDHRLYDRASWDIEAPAEQAELLRLGTVNVPTVWHLHGRIRNAANLILTPDGYHRLYPQEGESGSRAPESRHGAALATLRHLLASRTLVFIGFSLNDEHIGVEMRGVLDVFQRNAGPHYALVHRNDVERFRNLDAPVVLLPFENFGAPLLELVEELGRCVSSPSLPAQIALEPPKITHGVYLAAVANSLKGTRQLVFDMLTKEGVSVCDEIPPPCDLRSHRQAVVSALAGARLSVHLLDGQPGGKIEGNEEKTFPREQVRLGLQHARSQIVWVRRRPKTGNESQRKFIEELENRYSGRDANYEFHLGTPSNMISDILEKLKQPEPPPNAGIPPAVLLDTYIKEQSLVKEISRSLLDHNILPYIHPQEDDPRRNLDFLRDRLKKAGALVIFHGRVSVEWVYSRLDEAVKIVIKEQCPIKIICVYLAPPFDEKKIDLYSKYKFLNFHLLDNRNGFDPDTLSPLFNSLSQAGVP